MWISCDAPPARLDARNCTLSLRHGNSRHAHARTRSRTWQEYAELPVRHNEDVLNGELSKKLPWAVGTAELDSPHAKAHLLLQVRVMTKRELIATYHDERKNNYRSCININT